MAWAGWLRRHLMLYRVFCPRYMMAAALLLVVDVVGILVSLAGVRTNTLSIGDVFGWVELPVLAGWAPYWATREARNGWSV
ncbi:hypothetical protein VTK73DRAFT_1770 [Phialemonium thermophilum]|uniref:Uncharacterized protein n=1 Tax=Phialemonium thermophilum TaxID=223376 RepID=A0ABR3VSY8_9PEZI